MARAPTVAPGGRWAAGTLARWPCLGSSSTRTRSCWPSCARTGSSSSARSSPPSACGRPSSCCSSCGTTRRAGRTTRSSILALIPGLWLLGRFVRWRSYVVALTSTRILVRQGILGRDTVQLRLQRITEVNIRQELIERVLGTGCLVIDVQGEDDSLTLEYMRKPAVVQRVINSQINEIVGGGRREADPGATCSRCDQLRRRVRRADARRRHDEHDDDDEHDTPPFGVGAAACAPARPRPAAAPRPAPRRARPFEIGTASSSSTTCAGAASSPRRSSPPRRASCSTASGEATAWDRHPGAVAPPRGRLAAPQQGGSMHAHVVTVDFTDAEAPSRGSTSSSPP